MLIEFGVKRIMTWIEIFLCIIINGIWIIPLIYELVITPIQDSIKLHKKNHIWIEINGRHLRKLCVECKYCKWYWYHPIYGQMGFLKTKTPQYCKKFRKELTPDSSLRCFINDNQFAEFEVDS